MPIIHTRQITVADFFAHIDAPALLAEYATECAIEGLPKPNPHRALYEAMEDSGAMTVIGAFRGEALIGFAVMLVTLNPHYSVPIAVMESLFVAHAERKSNAGTFLLSAVESEAVKSADGLLISAPIGGALASVLSAHRSYRETNRVFFRGLR